MSEPIGYARSHAVAARAPVLAIITLALAAIGGIVPLGIWLNFGWAMRQGLHHLVWASILICLCGILCGVIGLATAKGLRPIFAVGLAANTLMFWESAGFMYGLPTPMRILSSL